MLCVVVFVVFVIIISQGSFEGGLVVVAVVKTAHDSSIWVTVPLFVCV